MPTSSRRVEVAIRGGSTVKSGHNNAERERISTPWKRSKNSLVKDEWRLQTGALSPTYGRPGRSESPAQARAHTSQGFHDRPQSPFSQTSGQGAGRHGVDALTVQRSLSTLQLSTSQISRTSSMDDSKKPPTLWVQDRYFTRPKTQVLCPAHPPARARGAWPPTLARREDDATEASLCRLPH